MAGEHLRRTHTSTGSKKKFTYSLWFKSNIKFTSNSYFFGLGGDGSSYDDSRLYVSGASPNKLTYTASDAGISGVTTDDGIRDISSWYHFVVAVDTTIAHANDRVKLYINGVRKDVSYGTTAAQNANISHNTAGEILLLGSYNGATNFTAEGSYSDIFNVDGQALTPDVFGFYKDGDGYMSSGTTQAIDFKPGQWSPRLPKSIKYTINRSGGFGVNGFYLPMNDSSNPGADFHCAPNSIIKLKGEDLPQPRNGAPTTSDAYVSQLRSDANAANLVLAVPGISTTTDVNQVVNGNFDNGTTSWTADTGATLTNPDGTLRITVTQTAGAEQTLSGLTVGERYTLSYRLRTDGTNFANFRITNNSVQTYIGNQSNTDWVKINHSFTANSSLVTLYPYKATGGWAEFDNFVVKQEDAPRDYSADIKGSGSNLTPSVNNSAGVGYEIPSYYGSALNFNTTGDHMRYDLDGTDYGTGDWTHECWAYVKSTASWTILTTHATNNSWDNGITLSSSVNSVRKFGAYISDGTTDYTISNLSTVATYDLNQWHHVAVERYGNFVTLYVNGVAEGVQEVASTYDVSVLGTPQSSTQYALSISSQSNGTFNTDGYIQDLRVYKGVAKYKGGFDVPKPYTPVGIEAFRTTTDTCKNNFGTWNPLYPGFSSNATFSDGNLTVSEPTSGTSQGTGTIGPSSGKWYYEARAESVTSASHMIGIRAAEWNTANSQNSLNYRSNGAVYNYSSAATSQATYTDGDIIGIAFDPTNGRLWFSKNGVWTNGDPSTGSGQNVNYTPSATTAFFAFDNVAGTQTWDTNFGQNPTFSGLVTAGTNADGNGKGLFKYAPPTGFLALCEDNLPTPAIADPGKHFKCVLYTGNGTNGSDGSQSIRKVGFQPDLVWVKKRGTAGDHKLIDVVRGSGQVLESNTTDQEGNENNNFTGFNSDGFDLGANNAGAWNESAYGYVAWCWKAGGAAVSNTDGALTSQVSVNQTAGFSIATYTTLNAATTFGHGLGKKPAFALFKARNNSGNWAVYHQSLGTNTIRLSTADPEDTNVDAFNSTSPTDTLMYLGTWAGTNGSNVNWVSYLWAEIEGFSKFGSYVGNGDPDGPFVYCGFKPAWVLIKKTNGSGDENWRLFDSSRCPTNQNNKHLLPSSSGGESTETGMDLLSNGFKIRDGDAHENQSGTTYIFASFAESPFKTANAK